MFLTNGDFYEGNLAFALVYSFVSHVSRTGSFSSFFYAIEISVEIIKKKMFFTYSIVIKREETKKNGPDNNNLPYNLPRYDFNLLHLLYLLIIYLLYITLLYRCYDLIIYKLIPHHSYT